MSPNPPADARQAASLILLRDGDAGLEVLMLRRAERVGDLRSGVSVFPGGALDDADRHAHHFVLGPDDTEANARLGLSAGGLAYFVAAVRETFEEAGLLLVCRPDGSPADLAEHAVLLASWRLRLQQGSGSMAELCSALDLRLDLRALHYHSHWLTPPGLPKRFDTRFFTAHAPTGQHASADLGEAMEVMWATPAAVLAEGSGHKLLPVTRRTLQDLGRFARAADAHADAGARHGITVTMPRVGLVRGKPRIVCPDEAPYAEIARLDPHGAHTAAAEIVPGVAVRLSDRIVRVTAPNAGVMTGPGTNTYLVRDPGDAAGGWTVIDPGPADDAHVDAIVAAAGERAIVHILATHTHPDHSPGAGPLAARTGAEVLGRRAPEHGGQDRGFVPAREPAHGERIVLGTDATLRVLHTPGHASNHLCYLLEEERTLFTGDHVMQGSTVVINPPDGDMAAYLRALEALLDEDLEWLAPGHGFLVAEPHALVRALIAHRMKREAKALAALRAHGPGDLAALVLPVYDDVPPALHPLAQRSLLAHLLKLRGDGLAVESAGIWSAG